MKNAKIISFVSFKNGVGKTTLIYLAAMNISKDKKILLIENKKSFSEIEAMTSSNFKYKVDDFKPYLVENLNAKTNEIVSNMITKLSNNLHIIPSNKDVLLSEEITLLYEHIKNQYEYVFIDNEGGVIGDQIININNLVDKYIYVGTGDLTSIQGFKNFKSNTDAKTSQKVDQILDKTTIIINMHDEFCGYDSATIKKISNRVITIPYDFEIKNIKNGYMMKDMTSINEFINIFKENEIIEKTDSNKKRKILSNFKALLSR